jgi:Rnl2 family RNA ligase
MFKKYNSIENTYRVEFLERIKNHGFWKEEFVVQEKVHGSNLSFWTTDGKTFYSGKRTGIINEDETFYNYEIVLKNIKPKLELLWNNIKADFPDLQQLTVFGELFGGDYPHPDVEIDKNSIVVQKGIFYSPKNHFYAFDILLNTEKYLDVNIANMYFEKVKLLHAKTIFKGSIDECLKYKNDFNTTIPKELGLPPLEPNIAEGVVIKPVKTLYFNNGVRVMLKNKNEKWSENKKYHKSIKQTDKPTEKIIKLQEAIITYVTENRLNNVISKIGEVTKKDYGRVLGMFNKDIVDDFTKDYHQLLEELDKKEVKSINKSIGNLTMKLVKEKLENFN